MPAYTVKKAWLYLGRSARLRCPICGISPLFLPAHRVEGLEDWYTTLPGCAPAAAILTSGSRAIFYMKGV